MATITLLLAIDPTVPNCPTCVAVLDGDSYEAALLKSKEFPDLVIAAEVHQDGKRISFADMSNGKGAGSLVLERFGKENGFPPLADVRAKLSAAGINAANLDDQKMSDLLALTGVAPPPGFLELYGDMTLGKAGESLLGSIDKLSNLEEETRVETTGLGVGFTG